MIIKYEFYGELVFVDFDLSCQGFLECNGLIDDKPLKHNKNCATYRNIVEFCETIIYNKMTREV